MDLKKTKNDCPNEHADFIDSVVGGMVHPFSMIKKEPRFSHVVNDFIKLFNQKALVKAQEQLMESEAKKAWKKLQAILGLNFKENVYNIARTDDNTLVLTTRIKPKNSH